MKTRFLYSSILALFFTTFLSAQHPGYKKVADVVGARKGDQMVGQVKNIIYPDVFARPERLDQPTANTTVYQEFRKVPKPQRDELTEVVLDQLTNTPPEDYYYPVWNTFYTILDRCDHGARIGRTYGDPHIQTFDGYRYDLHSVGEFVLCRSEDGAFEVQTRQAMVTPKMSMNSACAIKMAGDVVSIEAAPVPTPTNQIILVNGEEIEMNVAYKTPRGVRIDRSGNSIVVYSPLGEKVMVTPLGKGKYFSVVPTIVSGRNAQYEGLLGDADGDASNDLSVNGTVLTAHPAFYTEDDLANGGQISSSTAKAERSNLKMIAHDFGHHWRISNETSLFTYGPGRSTDYYTDLSYPREFSTIADHDEQAVRNAHTQCKNAGVSGGDLQGCVSDVLLTGDPKATEYTTSVQDKKIVENLKMNEPLLSSRTVESTPDNIRTARKTINRRDAMEARDKWWDDNVVKPTQTSTSSSSSSRTGTSNSSRTSSATQSRTTPKPVYRPPSRTTTKPPTRTQTRTISRPAPTKTTSPAKKSSSSSSKKR